VSTYFLDRNADMPFRKFIDVCIEANMDEKGSKIIVPDQKTKETIEGVFWTKNIQSTVEIVVNKNLFLTGFDVYKAMWFDGNTSQEEYDKLTQFNKDRYDQIALIILQTINKKGGL
jgi:hypothetical protein